MDGLRSQPLQAPLCLVYTSESTGVCWPVVNLTGPAAAFRSAPSSESEEGDWVIFLTRAVSPANYGFNQFYERSQGPPFGGNLLRVAARELARVCVCPPLLNVVPKEASLGSLLWPLHLGALKLLQAFGPRCIPRPVVPLPAGRETHTNCIVFAAVLGEAATQIDCLSIWGLQMVSRGELDIVTYWSQYMD